RLAVVVRGVPVRIFDSTDGRLLRSLPMVTKECWGNCCRWSADGRHLAVAETMSSSSSEIRIYDIESGKLAGPPLAAPSAVWEMSFRDGGKTLVVVALGDGPSISTHDIASGRGLVEQHKGAGAHRVVDVAISPDGRTVACAGHDHV